MPLVDAVLCSCFDGSLALPVFTVYTYVDLVWCKLILSAYFVAPYGCVGSIQFAFGVLILVNLFCLFGFDEFYVRGSVHHKSMLK
jgi:hypothetical protein